MLQKLPQKLFLLWRKPHILSFPPAVLYFALFTLMFLSKMLSKFWSSRFLLFSELNTSKLQVMMQTCDAIYLTDHRQNWSWRQIYSVRKFTATQANLRHPDYFLKNVLILSNKVWSSLVPVTSGLYYTPAHCKKEKSAITAPWLASSF